MTKYRLIQLLRVIYCDINNRFDAVLKIKKKCFTLHDPEKDAPDINRTHSLSLSNTISRLQL
jgi:hypothetical protein